MASMVAQTVKNPPAMQETSVQSLGWEDLLEEGMATHSSIIPGKSHGQKSLEDYSPWGRKELDEIETHMTTKRQESNLSSLTQKVFLTLSY